MQALARGFSSTPANPVLELFTPVDGVLRDVDQIEYAIIERREGPAAQVFPETGMAAAERIGVGHYVATYDVPGDAPLGRYAVRWQVRAVGEWRFETRFEVLAAPVEAPLPGYCLIQDLRDEGFEQVSDARIARCIELASRYIESVTGRFFEPRRQSLTLDGGGTCELLLDQPIIAVESVDGRPAAVVYGRHLSQGLALPDDRESPRLRLAAPRGHQNVRVSGLFGYTEPDGSLAGRTPRLIREVCMRLVARELPRLADVGAREDARQRHRLLQEKTREQSYSLDKRLHRGGLTGDPDIDDILVQFMRPVGLGAA